MNPLNPSSGRFSNVASRTKMAVLIRTRRNSQGISGVGCRRGQSRAADPGSPIGPGRASRAPGSLQTRLRRGWRCPCRSALGRPPPCCCCRRRRASAGSRRLWTGRPGPERRRDSASGSRPASAWSTQCLPSAPRRSAPARSRTAAAPRFRCLFLVLGRLRPQGDCCCFPVGRHDVKERNNKDYQNKMWQCHWM